MLVLSNFFFCRHVFKKTSAAEASESVYMRETVKTFNDNLTRKFSGCNRTSQFKTGILEVFTESDWEPFCTDEQKIDRSLGTRLLKIIP